MLTARPAQDVRPILHEETSSLSQLPEYQHEEDVLEERLLFDGACLQPELAPLLDATARPFPEEKGGEEVRGSPSQGTNGEDDDGIRPTRKRRECTNENAQKTDEELDFWPTSFPEQHRKKPRFDFNVDGLVDGHDFISNVKLNDHLIIKASNCEPPSKRFQLPHVLTQPSGEILKMEEEVESEGKGIELPSTTARTVTSRQSSNSSTEAQRRSERDSTTTVRKSPNAEISWLMLQHWGYEMALLICQYVQYYSEPAHIINSCLIQMSNQIIESFQRFGMSLFKDDANEISGVDQTTQSILMILSNVTRLSCPVRFEYDMLLLTSSSEHSSRKSSYGWKNPNFAEWLITRSPDQLASLKPSVAISGRQSQQLDLYVPDESYCSLDDNVIFVLGIKTLCIDLLEELWNRVRRILSVISKCSVSSILQEFKALHLLTNPLSCSSPVAPNTSASISQSLMFLQSSQLFSEIENLFSSPILPKDLHIAVVPVLRRLRYAKTAWQTGSLENPDDDESSLVIESANSNSMFIDDRTRQVKSSRDHVKIGSASIHQVQRYNKGKLNISTGSSNGAESDSSTLRKLREEYDDDNLPSEASSRGTFQRNRPATSRSHKLKCNVRKDDGAKRRHQEIIQKYCNGMSEEEINQALNSNVKGVYFNKTSGVWFVYFHANGKRHNKTFPVRSYGFLNAKKRAEEFQVSKKQEDFEEDRAPLGHNSDVKYPQHNSDVMKGVTYQPSKRAWVASWYENGKRRSLNFSVDDFGSKKAEKYAIKTRRFAESTGRLPDRASVLASDVGSSEHSNST